MTQNNQESGVRLAVIINGNPTQRKILFLRMTKLHFQCQSFESAEEALERMPALGRRPKIIITDLYMPGLDGWKLCRLLRSSEYAMFNDVPLLVISGTFAGEDAERITSDTGADAFLPLPMDEATFKSVVTRLVNRQSGILNRTPLLIVEDSHALRAALKQTFNTNGYISKIASTLSEAKSALKRQRFAIAIIDYRLPDGEGDQLLPIIKNEQPDCVSIMMTADSSPALAVQWMREGAAAYVRKPFDAKYLLEVCMKARREHAFLRVEELLEKRTKQLYEEEIKHRLMQERREATIKKKSEERRLLLDTIPNLVWYLSTPETYGPVNMPYARFLGRHPKDIAYRNVANILPPERSQTVIDSNKKVFKSGIPVEFEAWMPDAQGEVRLFSIIKTPKLDEEGDVEFVVCSGTDITDQRRAMEDRLKFEKTTLQVEKRESLKQMAGAVAHNFNNILSAVMGNLELAMMEPSTIPARALDDIKASMRAAEKAAELSRLMLVYLGQTIGRKQKIDLVAFCRKSRSLMESNMPATIALKFAFPNIPLMVNANSDQILMALMNLVTNAWEAMDGGEGTLTLRVGRIDGSRFSEAYLYPPDWQPESEQYAYIEIEDSGCGMTDEALNKIFDPFFSTKFTGRGVGLSVVSGIAKGHHGAVSVSSENFNGSTFRLYLPLIKK